MVVECGFPTLDIPDRNVADFVLKSMDKWKNKVALVSHTVVYFVVTV